MDSQTVLLLAKYNKTTNDKMNAYIKKLTDEQWKQEFKTFYKSIKLICNHIYIADFAWLKRLSTLREFKYINDVIFQTNIGFDQVILNGIDNYIEKRNILDDKILQYANEIKDEDMTNQCHYKDSHGKEYTRNYGGSILHMFNHETHHRGMISILMEEMGIDNDYSNLISLV